MHLVLICLQLNKSAPLDVLISGCKNIEICGFQMYFSDIAFIPDLVKISFRVRNFYGESQTT
jgi:hypothetical protein